MAPFRAPGRTNRSGRTQNDHDGFEGLPVRQWRRQEYAFGQLPPTDLIANSKDAWPELPMPKDSHMLPAWSQSLLRLARAGKLYKPAVPQRSEEERDTADEEEEEEAAKAVKAQKGFTAKRWAQVPPHLEEVEPQYLAKRRKGLPPLTAREVKFRETKVQKIDVEGNVNVYTVLVPEGQTVQGEIVEAAPIVATVPAVVPGTVIDGVGVVNEKGVVVISGAPFVHPTPPRRRPPPPRRRPKKGPSRSRKKLVPLPATNGAPIAGSAGSDTPPQDVVLAGIPTIKTEHVDEQAQPMSRQDSEMAEGQDGDEEMEEEGEEGEDADEGDKDDEREEGELSPSPESQQASSKPPERSPAPLKLEEASLAAADSLQVPPPPIDVSSPLEPEKASLATADSLQVPPPPRDVSSSPDLPLASAAWNSAQRVALEEPPLLDLPVSVGDLSGEAQLATASAEATNPASADAIAPPSAEALTPASTEAIARAIKTEDDPADEARGSDIHFEDGEVNLFVSVENRTDEKAYGGAASEIRKSFVQE